MNKLEILEDYLVNPRTMMLLPARQIGYETIVAEQGRQFLIKKTALELMEQACSKYGATFDGRRKSVTEQTGFKRRVPIPVSNYFGIYAFPTHAIKDFDCMWIFANHVHHVEPVPGRKQGAKEKSVVVFRNGLEYELEVSLHTVETQLDRARQCKYMFTYRIEQGRDK